MKLGGIINFKIDGKIRPAKGSFKYNLGHAKNETEMGADGKVHGYSQKAQEPKIEGEVSLGEDLSAEEIVQIKNATITLELFNGRTVTGKNMWFAGEGDVEVEDGKLPIKFVSREKLTEF